MARTTSHSKAPQQVAEEDKAFHAWYFAEGLLGMTRAREAAPGSAAWTYEQYAAFNNGWIAGAWAQRRASA